MAEYIRMVSYLNLYKNGEKEQNCGFAKIESRNGICRVFVNIQMPFIRERFDGRIHFFLREGDVLYGIYVGTATIENGKGFAGMSMVSTNIGNQGYGISEMAGMLITTDEKDMVIASEWDDIPIHPENFKKIEEKQDYIEGELTEIPEVAEDTEEETEQVQTEEICMETESVESREQGERHKEFWISLGKRCVRMDAINGFEECIRMKPNDIVCFPKRYWNLGQNSFLLHGYYNYRYLMAGRYLEDGREKYVLGVPGVYHGNERIMASMFGFGRFSGEETEGEKGYWCMNLE